MTARRQKKNKKMRGGKTHGWGSKKKHRGAGNRGGRGMAGTGKRADQNKPSVLKQYGSAYFGKKGFKTPWNKDEKIVNLDYIEKHIDDFSTKGLITKENDFYVIDIRKLGYDKLLGKGKIKNKYKIKGKTSKKAAEKVNVVGGVVEE